MSNECYVDYDEDGGCTYCESPLPEDCILTDVGYGNYMPFCDSICAREYIRDGDLYYRYAVRESWFV